MYGGEISCRKSDHDVGEWEASSRASSLGKRNTVFKISDAKQYLLKIVLSLTFDMPPPKSVVWISNTMACHCSKLCATGSRLRTRCRKIFIYSCLLHTVACVLTSFVSLAAGRTSSRKFWWRLERQVPLIRCMILILLHPSNTPKLNKFNYILTQKNMQIYKAKIAISFSILF